ncbi:hypothetical protein ELH93_05030 [Rhizobium leguminosarum]|nr:hypothetical protein ELI22_05165 [Rhizobium leguminosarum]TAV93219.1 hypothetical protein ELI21_05150 [Rhizobium leguminosarum]TAW34295.1 hypothetical protein ELI23_05190 [Rhizobium leguminosarum]TAY32007.1 hypothetical protein ELH93_05030 [Rhizobium leguminosarum]
MQWRIWPCGSGSDDLTRTHRFREGTSLATSTDSAGANMWPEIETAALAAFSKFANPRAPGLVSTLKRSAHYAEVNTSQREIIISTRAFLFGFLSYGSLDKPSNSRGNAATWVAAWLSHQVPDLYTTVNSGVTGTDELHRAFDDQFNVVVASDMSEVGVMACMFSATTVDREQADLRHFIAAFLSNETTAAKQFSAVGWNATIENIRLLKRELYARIIESPQTNEKIEAWEPLLLSDPEERLVRTTVSSTQTSVSDTDILNLSGLREELAGFDPDIPTTLLLNKFPPDLVADVTAFARLICLREADPPLSIGLFGGWGSGKSTFMQLLEGRIDKLTSDTREARNKAIAAKMAGGSPMPDKEPTFIRNAVQIRFNAWHFADANLWASLTAEFFDQLRAGGYSRTGKSIHTRLVEQVNRHIHTLTSEVKTAGQVLAQGEQQLHEAQIARDEAAAAIKNMPSQALGQTLVDTVTKSYQDHKADLRELGRGIRYDNAEKDIDDFIELAKSLQTTYGQIKTLLRFVFARGWRATMAVGGLLVVAVAAWYMLENGGAAGLSSSVILSSFAIIAGLGSTARALLPGIKIVAGLIDGTADFAANLDKTLEAEVKNVAQKEEALQRATAETDARRIAAERAARALARYVDPNSATANPPRLLRYMLEDDPDTRALEKEIGLISRVRRLFQAVDQIVQTEKSKSESDPDPQKRRDPDVPDRIIIYIDDLDRCTPPQVYAVLQAIHLLLAFRLFVVVVGVDVGWIEEALAHELRPSLKGFSVSSADPAETLDVRKLANRYMEKIFQLPFWLRPLSPEGDNGGAYGNFVRSMLEKNLEENKESARGENAGEQEDVEQQTPTGQQPRIELPGNQGEETKANGGVSTGSDAGNEPRVREPATQDAAYDQALETVKLTPAEVEFLSCEAIGRIAGGEPRTVKRFINIYRIVRARLEPAERASFLGLDGSPAGFPIAVLMIAMETGQPIEVAEKFNRLIASSTGDLSLEKSILSRPGSDLPEKVRVAAEAVAQARGGTLMTSIECRKWAKSTRRYSFNRYG